MRHGGELGGMRPQAKGRGGLWAALGSAVRPEQTLRSLRREPALPAPGSGTCGLLN